ncbi:MAG: sensor histidine kinase [Dehalococcoidia bacterium]
MSTERGTLDNWASKECAILEVVAPAAPVAVDARELRRRSLRVLSLAALAVAALAIAHIVVIDAFHREATDNFRTLVILVEVIFVGVLLAAAATHFLAVARERAARLVIDSLAADLAAPGAATSAPEVAVARLVGSRVASSALLALAREQGHRLEPVAACGYPHEATLEPRDSYGLVPPLPVVRQQVELADPWLDPVRERIGREPWIARVPILRGDDLLGLLIIADPQPGLISDPALLRSLSALLAVALSDGGTSSAARRAGVSTAEWTRHELIEATAAEFGPALLAVEAFAAAVPGDHDTVGDIGTIEDARRLSTLALSVERLGVIMSDLSTLGAGDEALVVGDAEPTDIAPILDASVDALEPAFTAREQALTLEIVNEPLNALVSPDAVERLLLHLLSNANRAAPDGGAVAVRATNLGDTIRIEVEDSGTAPADEHLRRATEPFHRIPEDAGEVPGAGLALAVARRLAESQYGHLEARRGDSGGAVYVVSIPVEPPAVDDDPTAPDDEEPLALTATLPSDIDELTDEGESADEWDDDGDDDGRDAIEDGAAEDPASEADDDAAIEREAPAGPLDDPQYEFGDDAEDTDDLPLDDDDDDVEDDDLDRDDGEGEPATPR